MRARADRACQVRAGAGGGGAQRDWRAPAWGVAITGDWTDPLALTLLEAVAPVEGVAGNNDGPALHERFGTRRVLDFGGVRIGLTHGHLGPGSTTPERARRAFEDEQHLGAIVFGHSHIPLVERVPSDTWLVNPGSPTDRRRQPACSWALMTIEDGAIASVELVHFDR